MALPLQPDLSGLPNDATGDRPWRKLAASVLLCALKDASGNGATGAKARRWLLDDSQELRFWITAAGLDPARVLPRLRRLVRHGVSRRLFRLTRPRF